MKRNSRGILAILMALAMLGLVACSGDGSSADEKYASIEAFNIEGDYAIPAVGYNEATAFTVEKMANFTEAKAAGETIKIKNGTAVNDRELIRVTLGEGKLPVKFVYVSDGRNKHVKADEQADGTFVADFKFDTSLSAHPLLVYIIHPAGMDDVNVNFRASKAKFVVKVKREMTPGTNEYLRDGVALMLPDSVLGPLGKSLGGALGLPLNNLSAYKGSEKEKYALSTEIPLKDLVDIDVTLPLTIGIHDGLGAVMAGEAANENVRPALKLNAATDINLAATIAEVIDIPTCVLDAIFKTFDLGGVQHFELTGILDLLNGFLGLLPQNISLILGDLLGGLTADMGDDPLLGGVLDSLNLEQAALFVGINHLPTDVDDQHIAQLGAGLFAKNNCTVVSSLDGDSARFPLSGVSIYDSVIVEGEEKPVLEETYLINQYKAAPAGAAAVIGEYIGISKEEAVIGIDLNTQLVAPLLGGLLGGMDIKLPASALPIPLGIPAYSRADIRPQWVYATINPAGISLDVSSKPYKLALNDVRLEYYEWGAKGSGQPLWLMSLDLCFALDLNINEVDDSIALKLSLHEPLSGVTVLKDDLGVGIFDNSEFHKALWAELGGMLGAVDGVMSMKLPIGDLLVNDDMTLEDAEKAKIDIKQVQLVGDRLFLGVKLDLASLLGGLL